MFKISLTYFLIMLESLRGSAERQFQKTLSLMQEGKFEEALKELEEAEKLLIKDPENEFLQANRHRPIKTSFIHIFEEKEIRLVKKVDITKESTEEFLALIESINASTDRKELKNLIEKNSSLIGKYSPLMHENAKNLNNLDFEEIKGKCQCILIPAS